MFIARQIFVSDKMTTRLFGYDSVRLTIEMEDCPASPLIKAIFKARRLTLHGVSKKRRKTYKRSRNNPSNHRLAKSITTALKCHCLVYRTGILTIHKKIMYCDTLDFSFVGHSPQQLLRLRKFNHWPAKEP